MNLKIKPVTGTVTFALIWLSGIIAQPALAWSDVTVPVTPAAITPPAGNVPFLLGHATGTQGYVCLPTGTGVSWTVNPSRPQATLFITLSGRYTKQILTHFLSPDTHPNGYAPPELPFGSPTWQSSSDSSMVWGNKLAQISAGSDPSCPTMGAIPCVLLQAIGSVPGPTGFGILTNTSYIQRLNTTGGAAPSVCSLGGCVPIGCTLSTDVGSQVLVPYTADYYFYTAQN